MILEVKGGEGGEDSKLFAKDLFLAYMKYCKRNGLSPEPLSASHGHYVMRVRGGWTILKGEIGKHCVQRVPPTERGGRRQTSYLTVSVLRVPDKVDAAVPMSDVTVKTQRGHGPGGQHQNKTDSAVRMSHTPTGITVFINGRSQEANRREAYKILCARVLEARESEAGQAHKDARKRQMSNAGRGSKIRTYNLIKGRATDFRTGKKTARVDELLQKGLFELLA